MKTVELLCLLLALCVSVHADFVLEVQLFRYRNPSGRTTIGICCDFDCRDGCDNRFVFCLRPSRTVSTNDNNCPLGRYQTGVIAGNDEVFLLGVLDQANGISNPLDFTGPLWPGAVQLYITVTDENGGIIPDVLVDRFFIDVNVSVGQDIARPTFFSGDERIGQIQLGFQVMCTENFYGLDCATFCMERDDELGHYTCDREGNIICREGYGNPSINCTCTVAEGCSSVGGYCLESGECLCYEGYSGDDCSIALASQGNSGAVAAGVVVALLMVVVIAAVIAMIIVFLMKRKELTLNCLENSKSSQEAVAGNPGENPTYTGDVANQRGRAPSAHSYEYISTNVVKGQSENHRYETPGTNRTYCYIANTAVQKPTSPSATNQSAEYETVRTSRTSTPAPSVHYETMATLAAGVNHRVEVTVDPASHYEFDEGYTKD